MNIDRIDSNKPFINYFTKGSDTEVKDKVNLSNIKGDNFLSDLVRMRQMAGNSVIKALFIPENTSHKTARNETPVVIVHGTMFEKESIQDYKDAALETGHPAELTTYMTIKEGEHLQKSGQVISKNINSSRISIAEKKLNDLKAIKNDPEGLKDYFQMASDLYGKEEPKVDSVVSLIPGVIKSMESLLKKDKNELLETFSGRTKEIEKDLTGKIMDAGYGNKKIAEKIAAEIMDTISPKAVLVGHSMGGFVSYTMALNPKEKINDGNEFTYDGANGVATVITLSSPIAAGVNKTLPKGLANLTYDLMEKNILDPMETFPGMQFCMINPFFSAWYSYNKAIAKEMYKDMSLTSAVLTNPLIHAMKPGFEQITEGSSFIKDYVKDKKVPQGITVIAVSNREDGVSEADRSKADETQPNAHNLDADVTIKPEDLKNPKTTRSTMAHLKMSKYPFEHGEEFKKEVLENPQYITRILDPANYDGVRWRCLTVIMENLSANPELFRKPEFKPVLEKINQVAEEKLPFKDSPSYVAKEILDKLK